MQATNQPATHYWCFIYYYYYYYFQNEMECPYYLRTGQCKFGSTCKFHHPQPVNMMVSLQGSPVHPSLQSPTTPSQHSYLGGVTNWSGASFIASPRWRGPSSYGTLLLPQSMVSVPSWNTFSVSLCAVHGFTVSFSSVCGEFGFPLLLSIL